MKFAISSNKTFSPKTYPLIISNFIENGIEPKDIYFFEGNHSKYKQIENKEGINYYHVPYNSMDFNTLISILELNLYAERWFVLQDTSTIDSTFLQKILNHPHNYPTTALCKYALSMNIGSYSWEYLQQYKKEIFDLKNQGDLTKYKSLLVQREDCFFNEFKLVSYYTDKLPTISEPKDIYGNGIYRVTQCYEDIGFCKTKANWFGKTVYEINL